MDAVILAAGLGTRMRPLTWALPKEMLPVVDRPAIQHVVEELAAAGVSRVMVVTSPRKPAIAEHFAAQPVPGVEIDYALQDEPRGLAYALRCAGAERAVLVAHGDALVETPDGTPAIVPRLIEAHEGADVVLAVDEVSDAAVPRSGIVVLGENDAVVGAFEKPDPASTDSRTAMMGRYVLGPRALATLAKAAPDAELADLVQRVIDDGGRVLAVPLSPGERRHDVGSLEGYCRTFVTYAERRFPELSA